MFAFFSHVFASVRAEVSAGTWTTNTSIGVLVFMLFTIAMVIFGLLVRKSEKRHLYLAGIMVIYFVLGVALVALIFATLELPDLPSDHVVSGALFLAPIAS